MAGCGDDSRGCRLFRWGGDRRHRGSGTLDLAYVVINSSLDLEHSNVEYASSGVDFSGGSGEKIKINQDTFDSNGTAA
jgi:hypothetical protein